MRIRAFTSAILCLGLAWLSGVQPLAADAQHGTNPPPATTLAVAAAADLKFALDDIVAQFVKMHPTVAVNVTYGSSGNFFSQLSNGAPFDMFFSADVEFTRRLAAAGLTLADSEFLYAVGRIVLWMPRSLPLDVQRLGITVLKDRSVRHIAIANPMHAPYGKAAEAAMKSLGVYDEVKAKLVFGENVAQAAQFAQSGSVEVGIIALSLAMAPALQREGTYWEVPLQAYPRMDQGGVIMKSARYPDAARSLRDFVLSGFGRATLKRYGFSLPGE
jgi:molybdate transport system substrate-binding protein